MACNCNNINRDCKECHSERALVSYDPAPLATYDPGVEDVSMEVATARLMKAMDDFIGVCQEIDIDWGELDKI